MKLISFVILHGVFTISNAAVVNCDALEASDFEPDKPGAGGKVGCYICLPGAAAKPDDRLIVQDFVDNPLGLFSHDPKKMCKDITELHAGQALETRGVLPLYVWAHSTGYGDGRKPYPKVFANIAKKDWDDVRKVWIMKEPVWVSQWDKMGKGMFKKDPCSKEYIAHLEVERESTRSFATCFYRFDKEATKANIARGARAPPPGAARVRPAAPESRGRKKAAGAGRVPPPPPRVGGGGSATSAMALEKTAHEEYVDNLWSKVNQMEEDELRYERALDKLRRATQLRKMHKKRFREYYN